MPAAHLGILRRCSGDLVQSQRQSRSRADARSFSQTLRFFQSLTIPCAALRQRERVVKLVSTAGTTHPCSGGQPGSLVGLRHRLAIAGVIFACATTPSRAPDYPSYLPTPHLSTVSN